MGIGVDAHGDRPRRLEETEALPMVAVREGFEGKQDVFWYVVRRGAPRVRGGRLRVDINTKGQAGEGGEGATLRCEPPDGLCAAFACRPCWCKSVRYSCRSLAAGH